MVLVAQESGLGWGEKGSPDYLRENVVLCNFVLSEEYLLVRVEDLRTG